MPAFMWKEGTEQYQIPSPKVSESATPIRMVVLVRVRSSLLADKKGAGNANKQSADAEGGRFCRAAAGLRRAEKQLHQRSRGRRGADQQDDHQSERRIQRAEYRGGARKPQRWQGTQHFVPAGRR